MVIKEQFNILLSKLDEKQNQLLDETDEIGRVSNSMLNEIID